MKNLLAITLLSLLTVGIAPGSDSIIGTYVAAFSADDESPIPGTISFVSKEKKSFLVVHLRGQRFEVPVTVHPLQIPSGTGSPAKYEDDPDSKNFDGVFSAEDLRSSVIVTGRFYNLEKGLGDGNIAIHTGAKIRENGRGTTGGKIELLRFTLVKLKAEQADADQPTTAVESKAEGNGETEPESEGRSQ